MIQQFPLRLMDSRLIAPSVRHFCFVKTAADANPNATTTNSATGSESETTKSEADSKLGFIPGQFLQVHFNYDDGKPTKRSYSIATVSECANDGVDVIEMAVSYVEGGAATKLFQNLKVGDLINASGPYGRFCLMPQDQNQRYLLVATGTGVTPYRAMLPELAKLMRERNVEVDLLFGARTESELLYGEEFDAFASTHRNFRFHPCFSRAKRMPQREHDQTGYVQDTLSQLAPNPSTDIVYLCGNPNMVDACFEMLKGFELPVPQIRREKYVSSK